MRETKFRGKSVKTGEWLSGYLFPRGLLNDPDYLSPLWIASGFENECMAVDEKTVGQCTGLRDKNGKEIYEGDIIQDSTFKDRGSYIMAVEWEKEAASFVLTRNGWAFRHYFYESSNPDDCEVIGNIHENQELLK